MEMHPQIILPLSPICSSGATELGPRVMLTPEMGWGAPAPWIQPPHLHGLFSPRLPG